MTARVAGRVPLAIALGVPTGVLMAAGIARFGDPALVLPLGAVIFLALTLQPRVTLALMLCGVVIFEEDSEGFLAFPQFYDALPGPLGPIDVLLFALIAGVALRVTSGGETFRTPGLLLLPLLLFAAAVATGLVTGFAGDPDPAALTGSLRDLFTLAVLPFLVVNVLTTQRDIQLGLMLLFALVVYKTATGATGYVLGIGRVVEGTVLTYYSPTANLLLLGFVFAVLGAPFSGIRLPKFVWCVAPVALAVLILSFRRSFWIALVIGVVIVVLVATGRRGRALLIPAGAVLIAAVVFSFTTLARTQSDSPVVQRVQSLSPSQVQTKAYERYRLDEQRNVWAEITRHPLTGVGLGVPWRARYPLAITFPGARDYSHAIVLWYWLKLGLIGVLAYIGLISAAVLSGLALWNRAPDPITRAAGLALGTSFLVLAVVETTGSFLGVSSRLTAMAAIVLGGLAAASVQLPPGAPPRAPAAH